MVQLPDLEVVITVHDWDGKEIVSRNYVAEYQGNGEWKAPDLNNLAVIVEDAGNYIEERKQ